MGRNRWIAIVALAAMAGVPQMAWAATVRGKLLRGKAAAPGVAVTLLNQQTKIRTAPAYSGSDGMYYITNVRAGSYLLEVWGKGNRVTSSFNIQVKEPESDVNPIYVAP
jgi:Carboxypeptidase regulatory-like domain